MTAVPDLPTWLVLAKSADLLKIEARGLAMDFEFDLPDLPTWPLLAKSGDLRDFQSARSAKWADPWNGKIVRAVIWPPPCA